MRRLKVLVNHCTVHSANPPSRQSISRNVRFLGVIFSITNETTSLSVVSHSVIVHTLLVVRLGQGNTDILYCRNDVAVYSKY